LKSTNCDHCQARPASVPLTRIDADGLVKLDLCAACARALQPESAAGCLACGLTAADLERTGRVGCAECYEVFAEQLAPIIEECQHRPTHKGKVPGQTHLKVLWCEG
jgi:protein arginine kinase activator